MNFSFSNIVKQILNESFQDFEYHFTSLNNVLRICQTGRIPLSHTFAKGAETYHNNGHTFYLSLTRAKDGRLGYSPTYNCRICFNGKALEHRYKGKAINYWKGFGDKFNYMKNLEDENLNLSSYKNADPYNFNKSLQFQSSTENEDRLLSNEPFIDDIERYITSIDILYLKPKYEEESYVENDKNTRKLIMACINSKYGKLIRIYGSKKDFNFGNDNIINRKFYYSGEYFINGFPESTNGDEIKHNLEALKKLFNVVIYFDLNKSTDKEKATYIRNLLGKYNLKSYERFIRDFININSQMKIDDIVPTFTKAISSLSQSRNEDSQYISKMMGDWMKKHGFKNFEDMYNTAKNNDEEYIYNNIDTNKTIKFLVFNDSVIIPNPDKTDFWKITLANERNQEYYKEQFVENAMDFVEGSYDNVKKQVRNNNYDKFRKYLQHLTRKCTITQMFALFKTLNVKPEEILDSNLTNFQYKELNYYDTTLLWIPQYAELDYDKRNSYNDENKMKIAQYYKK